MDYVFIVSVIIYVFMVVFAVTFCLDYTRSKKENIKVFVNKKSVCGRTSQYKPAVYREKDKTITVYFIYRGKKYVLTIKAKLLPDKVYLDFVPELLDKEVKEVDCKITIFSFSFFIKFPKKGTISLNQF